MFRILCKARKAVTAFWLCAAEFTLLSNNLITRFFAICLCFQILDIKYFGHDDTTRVLHIHFKWNSSNLITREGGGVQISQLKTA